MACCGTQAGVTHRLCQDDIARLRQRKDQCGDRRLRTGTDKDLSSIQMSKHRCQPFGPGLTVGIASPSQVISHQQFIICPHQYLRQTLFQHVVEVHAIGRWRGIHGEVKDSGQFDFRRRDIRAASAAALQQVAASGFIVGARDRRQVDVQLGCQLALRR
ncbi:hypothetical protein D3C72_1878060 [compost metagenome]